MLSRYLKFYKYVVLPDLLLKLNYQNVLETPKLQKIILSVSMSKLSKRTKIKTGVALELISGQPIYLTKSTKSIASLNIIKNQVIGCKSILINDNLFFFFDKLVNIILPNLPLSYIEQRNYLSVNTFSLTIKDFSYFLDLDYPFYDLKNLDITIVTSASSKEELKLLLTSFNFPF